MSRTSASVSISSAVPSAFQGNESASVSTSADRDASVALPERFVFGAVAFEMALPADARDRLRDWKLPAVYRPYLLAPSTAFARVTCTLQIDRSLEGVLQPEGAAYWQPLSAAAGDGLLVRGDEVAFDMQRIRQTDRESVPTFVVAARVASSAGLAQVLLLMAAAAVELGGGLCLHATAIVHADQAVLLLGPSGTGKTTAAQQLAPVLCFANDRVMVVPDGCGAYAVWALPVGTPPRLERHSGAVLPLGAMLRIVQAPHTRVRPISHAQAALYVREAAEVAAESGFFEVERLEAVVAVAQAAPGGIADILLGHDWRAALAAFMSSTSDPARTPNASPNSRDDARSRNPGVHG
jgi:hypothetical protein